MELKKLFADLLIPENHSIKYVEELSRAGIHDDTDLGRFASMRMLEENIGMHSYECDLIMQRLHSHKLPERKIPGTILSQFIPRITKDSVLTIREIGHSETGRVLKSLFCPTLTFVALKKITIEDALVRKAVGNEVKTLYKIARSYLMDPDIEATIKEDQQYTFMSEQVYDYVYGIRNGERDSNPYHGQPVNSPYIVKFYSSFIDPSDASVCVVLEFMNSGSIQSLINNGKKFCEDDAIVIAFVVLNALVDLHGVGMTHRNIKPSNILTNTVGEVKISDFGMTKELLELSRGGRTFISDIAYMSKERLQTNAKYGFESDIWSLGITLIVIITGQVPYPTKEGQYQLIKAILESPEPTLPKNMASSELHDLIHLCLTLPVNKESCAKQLLDHPIFSLARERGLLSLAKHALLPTPPKIMSLDFPLNKNIDKAVDAAISWQLQCLEEYEPNDPRSGLKMIGDSSTKYVANYSSLKIKWLATQMGIDSSKLEEKFEAKNKEINKLINERVHFGRFHMDQLQEKLQEENQEKYWKEEIEKEKKL